jgi:hypothetical protein
VPSRSDGLEGRRPWARPQLAAILRGSRDFVALAPQDDG